MSKKFNDKIERRKKFFKIVPGKIKGLQFKIFKLIIITVLISMAFTAIGFYGVIHVILNTAELGRYAETQLRDLSYWINLLFLIVILISIFIGGILSFELSHRIAGPIYRIQNSLREILDGRESIEIKIRPKDELHDMVEILNKIFKEKLKNG